MSNAPYVTNTTKNVANNRTTHGGQPQHHQPSYASSGSTTNAYGSSSTNAYGSSSTGGGGYGQPSSSAYGPPITTTTSSSYGQPPSSSTSSYGAPANTYSSSNTTSNSLPSFSNALNNPPPSQLAAASAYAATPLSSSPYGGGAPSSAYGAPSSQSTTDKTAYNPYQAMATQQQQQQAPVMAVATALSSSTHVAGAASHGIQTQTTHPVKCHKIDYEIRGSGDLQLVEIILDPGETVIAEAGGMLYLENDVDFKSKLGDGSEPKQGFWKKAMAAGGRLLTGESLFVTHFTNTLAPRIPVGGSGGSGGSHAMQKVSSDLSMTRRVAFAAPYPGTIMALDMLSMQQSNPGMTAIICQKDAFLCAALGTKISIYLHKRIGTGFFGGEGFILQKLEGDGMVFCHAGGCIIQKQLKRGEKLRVDTGCLVAFTHPGIDYSIQMAGGLKSMFFGGEGFFLATLEGEGTVWLQSLPLNKLADKIMQGYRGGSTRNEGGGFSAASFMP